MLLLSLAEFSVQVCFGLPGLVGLSFVHQSHNFLLVFGMAANIVLLKWPTNRVIHNKIDGFDKVCPLSLTQIASTGLGQQ